MKDNISDKSAASLIYYLILSDGKITEEEEEKFEAVCKEFKISKTDMNECRNQCKEKISEVIEEDDYEEIVSENVQSILNEETKRLSYLSFEEKIPIKLFLWDILCVAYSDGDYSQVEKKIVKKIKRAFDLDKSLYQEMVSAQDTVKAIKKEVEELKDSDLPYREVEILEKDLEKRISVIENSIKLLIK